MSFIPIPLFQGIVYVSSSGLTQPLFARKMIHDTENCYDKTPDYQSYIAVSNNQCIYYQYNKNNMHTDEKIDKYCCSMAHVASQNTGSPKLV
jgi:hypothetical protein